MARVIRLTEQELVGLLTGLAKMFVKKDDESDSETSDVSNDTETEDGDDETSTTLKPIGKVSAKGQELLNNPIFKGSAANEQRDTRLNKRGQFSVGTKITFVL